MLTINPALFKTVSHGVTLKAIVKKHHITIAVDIDPNTVDISTVTLSVRNMLGNPQKELLNIAASSKRDFNNGKLRITCCQVTKTSRSKPVDLVIKAKNKNGGEEVTVASEQICILSRADQADGEAVIAIAPSVRSPPTRPEKGTASQKRKRPESPAPGGANQKKQRVPSGGIPSTTSLPPGFNPTIRPMQPSRPVVMSVVNPGPLVSTAPSDPAFSRPVLVDMKYPSALIRTHNRNPGAITRPGEVTNLLLGAQTWLPPSLTIQNPGRLPCKSFQLNCCQHATVYKEIQPFWTGNGQEPQILRDNPKLKFEFMAAAVHMRTYYHITDQINGALTRFAEASKHSLKMEAEECERRFNARASIHPEAVNTGKQETDVTLADHEDLTGTGEKPADEQRDTTTTTATDCEDEILDLNCEYVEEQ